MPICCLYVLADVPSLVSPGRCLQSGVPDHTQPAATHGATLSVELLCAGKSAAQALWLTRAAHSSAQTSRAVLLMTRVQLLSL